jgi:hypothetical protein
MMSVGKNRVLTESCWEIPIISMNMNKVIRAHSNLCVLASAVSFSELSHRVYIWSFRTNCPKGRKRIVML